MHSGQAKSKKNPLNVIFMPYLLFIILLIASCAEEVTVSGIAFKYPDQGQSFALGEDVKVALEVPKDEKFTAVTYLLDGKELETKSDAAPIVLKTSGLAVGYRIISAIVDRGDKKDTVIGNIVLKSNFKPKPLGYKVIKEFPHDTSSYTQGLEYHEGKFLESTGQYGFSTLRWVDIASGKALQRIDIDKKYFAEGATLVGDKIIMLSYRENVGFVYDAKTFKQLATFPYPTSREGWGLCYDGKQLIMTDGTNRLYFMNAETFTDERVVDVYDNAGAVDSLNELEYINGKLYANVYQQDYIVVIDPNSGIVEQKIDLSGLIPKSYFKEDVELQNDVLNGIAWDKQSDRLFVTGKKWPKLFEIKLVPKK